MVMMEFIPTPMLDFHCLRTKTCKSLAPSALTWPMVKRSLSHCLERVSFYKSKGDVREKHLPKIFMELEMLKEAAVGHQFRSLVNFTRT